MALNVNGFFPGELLPNVTVGGCIDIFEKVWPNPQNTIDLIEKECEKPNPDAYWQRAETIGNGVFQKARTNKELPITHLANLTDNSLLQNIHNQFNMLLLATTIPYKYRYGIEEGMWHENYAMLKYETGQEYKLHYDSGSNLGRAISALVYLNNDYDGGEIEFPNFEIKIKPEPGMLILFPSNFAYSHIAHPVTSGIKYSLVTWIKDRQISHI